MELEASSIIAGVITLLYLGLLSAAWRNRQKVGMDIMRWLVAVLILATLASAVSILSADSELIENRLSQTSLVIYLLSLMLVAYGGLTLAFFLQRRPQITLMLVIGLIWCIAVIGLGILGDSNLGDENWIGDLIDNPDPAGLVAIGGWGVIALILLALSFQKFYSAGLPEVANRALFWAMVVPLVLMGAVLNASHTEFLREIGWVVQLVGIAGVVYGVVQLRVVDIRQTMRLITVNFALTIVTAILILGVLLVAEEIRPDSEANRRVIFVGLALIAAALYGPLYLIAQAFTSRMISHNLEDMGSEVRRFVEEITGVVEIDELAQVVMNTLRDVMRVRRGALLLVSAGEHATALKVEAYRVGLGEIPPVQSWLNTESSIYGALYKSRRTVLQFDLDYAREYADIVPMEREFFRQLRMAAFAPIVVQNRLIGILACGPKANDAPFSPSDLELMTTIANQTGIALRNSRLVDDLRKREHDVAESNKRLEAAKRQLEALDAVKTDFITIASHELRTPLAQIRGHTDIIEALNEQGILDQDQLSGLTTNLRKAADRLETLIGDMLDVSQLDLSAMDLRFAQTTIENVVRLAIEPLQESIRNRKQSLTARGLRGLPVIEADMQRLVQAIRNVVLNAVKFTPDGGRIDIIGSLVSNTQTGKDELQIAIKDTGIGIDPKNHEAVFEKFFRTTDPGLHSTGTTKFMGAGPGLGLTIARGVITGHGGRAWVESEGFDPDKLPGSTFYIVLPITPPEGGRRVMSFSGAPERRPTQPKPPAGLAAVSKDNKEKESPKPIAAPAASIEKPVEPPVEEQEPDADEPFIETNPTIINPAASRVGLTSLAKAAAEEALAEIETSAATDEADADDNDSQW